jgi:hypothetical protein
MQLSELIYTNACASQTDDDFFTKMITLFSTRRTSHYWRQWIGSMFGVLIETNIRRRDIVMHTHPQVDDLQGFKLKLQPRRGLPVPFPISCPTNHPAVLASPSSPSSDEKRRVRRDT